MNDVARALMATAAWLAACTRGLLRGLASSYGHGHPRDLAGAEPAMRWRRDIRSDFDDFEHFEVRGDASRPSGKRPHGSGTRM